jgi:hypothetical protein
MRITKVKRFVLLALLVGESLPSDLWFKAWRAMSRKVSQEDIYRAIRECSSAGLVAFVPKPLSGREVKRLLKALSQPGVPLERPSRSEFVRLTSHGFHLADLLSVSEGLPFKYRRIVRVVMRRAMNRQEVP